MHADKLIGYVDTHRDLIFAAQKYIWQHPETGYNEWETSRYLAEEFKKLGYNLTMAGNIPGFYTDISTGSPGPTVLIMGEMDSLLCHDHPQADKNTGAVHACGHSAQCAALLGIAAALKSPGALDGLSGNVRLCAVPAEELIQTQYREELRQKGIIKYFGGKVEFLSRGYFDGVDMAVLIHTGSGEKLTITRGGNGCCVKNITYTGRAAHAGGAPHDGVNALYAATLGIQAINSLRETFKDEDHIRVHPIITSGGTAVNAIPSRVTLESYVRGADIGAINLANAKVNLALAGSAAALSANVFLSDRPGYMPLINDAMLRDITADAARMFLGEDEIEINEEWSTGCTDMGDLSAVMPVIQPFSGGAKGIGHGNDYCIADAELACVIPAKCYAALIYRLLAHNAARAHEVIKSKNVIYKTHAEYFAALHSIFKDKYAVVYNDGGKIELDI